MPVYEVIRALLNTRIYVGLLLGKTLAVVMVSDALKFIATRVDIIRTRRVSSLAFFVLRCPLQQPTNIGRTVRTFIKRRSAITNAIFVVLRAASTEYRNSCVHREKGHNELVSSEKERLIITTARRIIRTSNTRGKGKTFHRVSRSVNGELYSCDVIPVT